LFARNSPTHAALITKRARRGLVMVSGSQSAFRADCNDRHTTTDTIQSGIDILSKLHTGSRGGVNQAGASKDVHNANDPK